ncbi:hypothetical protein [Zoogloea sp.]|uniref:hypothetical protein n=1 Tax=Zoogloea sp. TaxID=49181 RepID=UPI0026028D14|nr:hypothetical protein [Zoogloea sp.]MDD3354720.1 hypothetical protein [Zoogloea sp.]
MDPFYNHLPPEEAVEIEKLSRLMYEVRTARDEMLSRLNASTAEQALAAILSGDLPEHPGYEHYLSVRMLSDLHAQVRADVAARLAEVNAR